VEQGPSTAGEKGRKIKVNPAGGADFRDIGGAIAAAHSGDTIEVAAGRYYGTVDFSGKQLHIVGTDGPAATWIYASPGSPAVKAHHGEGKGAILEGFTVTGGGNDLEAAIDESFSSLTLRNVELTGNKGFATIYARSAIMTLDRVTIDGDNTASLGVTVQGRRGMIAVKDSTIHCGESATGYIMEHGAGFLDGVTFDCPGGAAAEFFHSNGRVQRSVLDGLLHVENEDADAEKTTAEGSVFLGGVYVYVAGLELSNAVVLGGVEANNAKFTAVNTIFAEAACATRDTRSTISVSYSDFYGNTDNACGGDDPVGKNGNIDGDPKFVDAAGRDFRLEADSPCVNAGSATGTFDDLDGTRSDIGAFGGPFSMEGGW
jgi:hypothetical protein